MILSNCNPTRRKKKRLVSHNQAPLEYPSMNNEAIDPSDQWRHQVYGYGYVHRLDLDDESEMQHPSVDDDSMYGNSQQHLPMPE